MCEIFFSEKSPLFFAVAHKITFPDMPKQTRQRFVCDKTLLTESGFGARPIKKTVAVVVISASYLVMSGATICSHHCPAWSEGTVELTQRSDTRSLRQKKSSSDEFRKLFLLPKDVNRNEEKSLLSASKAESWLPASDSAELLGQASANEVFLCYAQCMGLMTLLHWAQHPIQRLLFFLICWCLPALSLSEGTLALAKGARANALLRHFPKTTLQMRSSRTRMHLPCMPDASKAPLERAHNLSSARSCSRNFTSHFSFSFLLCSKR